MERLCDMEIARGSISRIYKILVEGSEMEVPSYIKKWEREIGQRGKNQEVGKILILVHGSLVNIGMMEINYKCLTWWYRTPDIVGMYQTGQTME